MPAPRRPQRGRRKVKKNIPIGQAHIKTSFNNTIVSLTDRDGNVIAWESAGGGGFKGSRKGRPSAAQGPADAAPRLGVAGSRRQARQLSRQGHWTVNGRRVDIPSYQVRANDVIAFKAGSDADQG